jgi:CRP-like cAMP-binding protein
VTNISCSVELIENSSCLSEIFHNCPYRILKTLEIVTYRPGQFICRQGQCQNSLFVIIAGKVEVYYQAENGKKHLKYYFQEGAFLGELELYDKSPSSSYVRALTQVKLFRIKREICLEWINADNHFCEYLFKQVSKKYYNYSLNTSKNLLYSAKYRICSYLISFCAKHHQTTGVEIEFDKSKFTKLFTISTRNLNRTLHNLRDLNAIEIRKNSVLVKDVQVLKAIQEDCCIRDDAEIDDSSRFR